MLWVSTLSTLLNEKKCQLCFHVMKLSFQSIPHCCSNTRDMTENLCMILKNVSDEYRTKRILLNDSPAIIKCKQMVQLKLLKICTVNETKT